VEPFTTEELRRAVQLALAEDIGSGDATSLATWMDTYAQRAGHFTDAQEKRLVRLRSTLAGRFGNR